MKLRSPKTLPAEVIEELRKLIVEQGYQIRRAASSLGLAVGTVRFFVHSLQWPVAPSKGGMPCQGKHDQPLLTRQLLMACQRENETWSDDFFELVGIRPIGQHPWLDDLINSPIDLLSYRELEAMAREHARDPGPMLLKARVQSAADRYELFVSGTGIREAFSYE